jgi:hypothetical protein
MRLHSLAICLAISMSLAGCDREREATNAEDPDAGLDTDVEHDVASETDANQEEPQRIWPEAREGCNGHPDLCERPFHEVVFPTTHNAMGNAEDEWIAPNQNLPLRDQLIDGIRAFMLDTYDEDGEILLCHAFCLLGSRPLLDAMEEFRTFLEENPDEVVTIIFEDHIDGDQTVEVLQDAGLVDFVYTHDEEAGWPTLGEMIAANTRLVVTNESARPPPAWMHHIWDLGWDTPYSFDSPEEFTCTPNRGTMSGGLFLINHWVLDPIPRPSTAEVVNSYEVLMARVEECHEEWDRLPTFLAIDFHDIGDLFEVVDVLNGLAEPRADE